MITNKKERIKYIMEHPDMSYADLAKAFGISKEGARTFCRRHYITNNKKTDLTDAVAKLIKSKKWNLRELADYFGVAPKLIEKAIDDLQARNVIIDNYTDGGFQLAKEVQPTNEPHIFDSRKYQESEYTIGFVADTHLGSKYERLDVLEALYNRFADYGIDTVYHGGNWIDGEHRFNKYDIYINGVEGQIENFVQKYPKRQGIKTYLISGDDHEGWYVQREHVNVGQIMQDRAEQAGREDLINLGYMERDIKLQAKNGFAMIRLIHAGGGSTYAHSYTAQKYVEALQGGEKPRIVLVGHYHKFNWSYPREVHVIQGGCFTGNTNIITDNGKKKIKNVIVGDKVLTDTGCYKSVTKTFVRDYDDDYIVIKYGRKNRSDNTITCTKEHPIKVWNNGDISYKNAIDLTNQDYVFVKAGHCKVCGNAVPHWFKMCQYCNPMQLAQNRFKLSKNKGGFKSRLKGNSCGKKHLEKDILPFCSEMQDNGWKIVPVGADVIPDAIGYKDGKIVAFELETRKGELLQEKKNKYNNSLIKPFINEIKWIDVSSKKQQPRCHYKPYNNDFVLVKVLSVKTKKIKTKKVYNLEVEDNHTYVAGNICVHNCTQDQTPFMRKKKIQAMLGGCVIWIKQNDLGVITSVKVEWLPFYDKKFYKYHW